MLKKGLTMKFLNEFKEFAVKGDVVDMGVGIVIGAAFTSIVESLVKDVFNPILGALTTGADFSNWFITLKQGKSEVEYTTLLQARTDGAVTLNVGLFINAVISFLIVSLVLFFIIRAINKLKRPEEVTADPVKTKECPFCFSNISSLAIRCPHCTSEIKKQPEQRVEREL
jgi:large conductance mechanosensitive channel